ncbi:MAG: NAD-binding protein [Pleurocapsa sp. SU_196_0]|nr:NAD-binding protein [Pleurocapsa sp. SU_196_0]
MLGVNILALAEVLAGLEKQGVKSATALEVINASSGRSNVSMNLYPERVVGRKFPNTFALALMAKDVRIAAQSLREQGVPSPVTALTEQLLEVACVNVVAVGPAASTVCSTRSNGGRRRVRSSSMKSAMVIATSTRSSVRTPAANTPLGSAQAKTRNKTP